MKLLFVPRDDWFDITSKLSFVPQGAISPPLGLNHIEYGACRDTIFWSVHTGRRIDSQLLNAILTLNMPDWRNALSAIDAQLEET